jgi:alkyl hydroperoxide reductase subunit AhpF
MLAETDLARIGRALSGRAEPLELDFDPAAGASDFGAALKRIAEAVLAAAAGGVILKQATAGNWPARPALTISAPGRGSIHYLALPEGREARPFVEALIAEGPASMEAKFTERLRALHRPVELYVFMAGECPHCPAAVQAANSLALASERISTFIIDTQRFTDLSDEFKVSSVPLTVIDRGLSLGGVKPVSEIAEAVLSVGTPGYRTRHLLSLLESRRTQEAVDLICGNGGPRAFLAAWQQSATSSRMGLLLVVEQALERTPEALGGIVPNLCEVLGAEDASMRGDTADLLGKIGHPAAAPALRALLSDPNADVAEIAAEVLQELQG